jgi:hypothetical protein
MGKPTHFDMRANILRGYRNTSIQAKLLMRRPLDRIMNSKAAMAKRPMTRFLRPYRNRVKMAQFSGDKVLSQARRNSEKGVVGNRHPLNAPMMPGSGMATAAPSCTKKVTRRTQGYPLA